jgi:hypothetical protein
LSLSFFPVDVVPRLLEGDVSSGDGVVWPSAMALSIFPVDVVHRHLAGVVVFVVVIVIDNISSSARHLVFQRPLIRSVVLVDPV